MIGVPTPDAVRDVVPMHPRAGARTDEVRWIIPPGALSARGIVTSAPGGLDELLRDGTLAEVRAEHGCVITRATAGQDWQRIGPAVRSALTAALSNPGTWRTTGTDAELSGADARIAAAARRLLDGEIGSYARTHGGEITLVDVSDRVAEVRLHGACRSCPAAEMTLRARFEERLRQQCPELAGVRSAL